jgi:hypothetical protein
MSEAASALTGTESEETSEQEPLEDKPQKPLNVINHYDVVVY